MADAPLEPPPAPSNEGAGGDDDPTQRYELVALLGAFGGGERRPARAARRAK